MRQRQVTSGAIHVLEPLGTRAQVLALLGEVYPLFASAYPVVPEGGILKLDDDGAEIHIPDGDPLQTLSFRPGDLESIWRICDRLGARMMDTGDGAFLKRDGDAADPGR